MSVGLTDAKTSPGFGGAGPLPVLVVDDSKAQRRVLALQLQRWGYAVVEAATGEEALEVCRSVPFEMVLSDWMMPGMTGLEFCEKFKAMPRERSPRPVCLGHEHHGERPQRPPRDPGVSNPDKMRSRRF